MLSRNQVQRGLGFKARHWWYKICLFTTIYSEFTRESCLH